MQKERPLAITIICILGFIGAGLSILSLIFFPFVLFLTPLAFISSFLGLVSMVGLWNMKRWGLYLYSIMFAVNLLLMGGRYSAFSVIVPLIVVGAGFYYYNLMD